MPLNEDAPENDGDFWETREPKTLSDPMNSCLESPDVETLKAKQPEEETGKDVAGVDVDASCVATCSTNGGEEEQLKDYSSIEPSETGNASESGDLTSCVGTRWYRAPELLYGSTSYGQEIDLWSVGCIFAELLNLDTLFSGNSDIDQLGRIINVLGNPTEEVWPGCSNLPDYKKISFTKVDKPVGLEACLSNRTRAEVKVVGKLLCFDPATRAAAVDMLQDKYFMEEPLPLPLGELTVPTRCIDIDDEFSEEWSSQMGLQLDPGQEDFSNMDVLVNDKGFTIRF